jgi:amino-acid N-acetyltransferase
MIRKATQEDVRFIHKILADYGKQGILLPRSLNSVYESLRDFVVAEDEAGRSVGCCALKISWENLVEVRSLAVLDERNGQGWGSKLVEACLSEALTLGFSRAFTLTYQPGFFKRFGFREVDKNTLPQKIWADCINCVSFPDCDEVALLLEM